jgi:hypothetical protein
MLQVDGDLESATYFEDLFRKFETDPALGSASGKSWIRVGNRSVPEGPATTLPGPIQAVSGRVLPPTWRFVREVMWDGLTVHLPHARLKARSFA